MTLEAVLLQRRLPANTLHWESWDFFHQVSAGSIHAMLYICGLQMYVGLCNWNVHFLFSCWFSHLVLLADPIKLPRCIKGENKPPLSRLTQPASLQFITNALLPASCVVRVQMWNRAEVTNPVHLTASTHCLTIHSSESCVWGAW